MAPNQNHRGRSPADNHSVDEGSLHLFFRHRNSRIDQTCFCGLGCSQNSLQGFKTLRKGFEPPVREEDNLFESRPESG